MILRDPKSASSEEYDVIVLGAGIHGVMLALESARIGLRPLVLERSDFGGATSYHSLRILHGGLRYLQALDLRRFRESVAERSWFMRNFPDLVESLPCVMPLYSRGLRRASILKLALSINDFLSRNRNRGVLADRSIPPGRLLTAAETIAFFPGVNQSHLEGGALWYDGVMLSSQRLLMESLRWACANGATCLNYVEGRELRVAHGKVVGIVGFDYKARQSMEFRAPMVVNCGGPWCRSIAKRFDRDVSGLFRPCLLINIQVAREPLAKGAIAVTARRPGARTFFMYPFQGGMLIGTYHAPWLDGVDDATPTSTLLNGFLDELNEALPGVQLTLDDIEQVFSGFVPAKRKGSPEISTRAVIWNHGEHGGPRGLHSLCGVKFTTARRVAQNFLRKVFGVSPSSISDHNRSSRPVAINCPDAEAFLRLLSDAPERAIALVEKLVKEEAIIEPDDLIKRRTNWGMQPALARQITVNLREMLDGASDRPNDGSGQLGAKLLFSTRGS